jgi:hypothetical protein
VFGRSVIPGTPVIFMTFVWGSFGGRTEASLINPTTYSQNTVPGGPKTHFLPPFFGFNLHFHILRTCGTIILLILEMMQDNRADGAAFRRNDGKE